MNIQEKLTVGALIPDFHRVWELNYLVDLYFLASQNKVYICFHCGVGVLLCRNHCQGLEEAGSTAEFI